MTSEPHAAIGDKTADGRLTPAVVARFVTKFVQGRPEECWIWAGGRSSGYGSFAIRTGSKLAHRISFELYVRPIGPGEVIDHVCHNRSCVNPHHLEAVDVGTNNRRSTAYAMISLRGKSKTHCKRGHPLFGPNLLRDHRGDRMCKACQRAKADEWRAANRARVNELQRARRARASAIGGL